MFEKLKKILKRNCKNQGKNITTCTVVAFLLSCNLVMAGNGFGYDFNFDGSDIKITEHQVDGSSSPWAFDKDDTTQFDGKFAEDKWDNLTQTFTQNGTINLILEAKNGTVEKSTGISIQTKPTIALDEEVYGLKLSSNNSFNFIQNGTIAISYAETEIEHTGSSEADITRKDKGNGLVIADDGITVDVNGNIKGEVELHGADDVDNDSGTKVYASTFVEASANGIYTTNSTSTIENITGTISGQAFLIGGNNISGASNNFYANTYAKATNSANGIYTTGKIEDKITGTVNGYAILIGGNDISIGDKEYENIRAYAYARAETSANGIYTKSTIENITGSINGRAILIGGENVSVIGKGLDIGSNNLTGGNSYALVLASANGIYTESTIENIAGSINGKAIAIGGDNVNVAFSEGSVANGTSATVRSNAGISANGIYTTGEIQDKIAGSINGFAILQRGSVGDGNKTPNTDISIQANGSANGIYFKSSKDINNSGKIQGYAGFYNKDGNLLDKLEENDDSLSFSGNGIAFAGNKIDYNGWTTCTGIDYTKTLNNIGVIAGSESAVAVKSISGSGAINNYGIMAGKKIIGNGQKDIGDVSSGQFKNSGLTLILKTATDSENDKKYFLEITEISAGYNEGLTKNIKIDGEDYNIWNAKITDNSDNKKTDSIKLKEDKDNPYDKYIFNGINNTIAVESENSNAINNSVINAFKTAVSMEGGTLYVTDTVINGGADISYEYDKKAFDKGNYDPTDPNNNPEDVLTMHPSSPAVKFTQDNNQFFAYGSTVINGDIEIDSKGNEITLGLHSQLNGNIIGNVGNNILHLGTVAQDKGESVQAGDTLNIQHDITNIDHIDIDNNVTFYENISVTGVDEITIKENGVLNLRIAQSEEKQNIIIDGTPYDQVPVAEHALDGNSSLKITGLGSEDSTGKLNFITNGIGKEVYIPISDIEVENVKFDVSSVIDKATVGNNYVFIGAGKDLNDIFNPSSKPGGDGSGDSGDSGNFGNRYEQLNKIYKSIYSSDDANLTVLRDILMISDDVENYDEVTDEEQLKNLLNYLNGVYSHSPYAFSSELSRKSVGMFRDIVTDNSFIPNYQKWLVMGGLTHQDGGTTDTYYGKNYHDFDTGTADVDADSKLTGAYVLAKYGYSDKVTLGITAGGNKGDTELSTDSKVKDNAGYVGGFIENYRGNLTLKAGAGVQYSEFDADRKTVNDSYSDKYSDMTYDIYGSLRYSLPLDNNFFLEPYGVLSYTYIDQEGADEGSKALAIETDDKEFNYTTVKAGVDLKKVIPTEKATHTLTAGISYERFLDGDDEEYITGRMNGLDKKGTDFDILVAHKNKHQISLNAKYEVEREDGILFNLKGEYSFQRDEHNNGAKNKTEGEWTVGASIGYKF